MARRERMEVIADADVSALHVDETRAREARLLADRVELRQQEVLGPALADVRERLLYPERMMLAPHGLAAYTKAPCTSARTFPARRDLR